MDGEVNQADELLLDQEIALNLITINIQNKKSKKNSFLAFFWY